MENNCSYMEVFRSSETAVIEIVNCDPDKSAES